MATPFQTYEAVGQAEDVKDIIYNISPTETPFMSSVKKGTATAIIHSWQTDELAAVGTNANLEGSDATFSDETPTTLLSNYTQIFRKTATVSDTLEVVKKYGRKKETAYLLEKKSKELARDIEYALVGAGRQAGGAGTVNATGRTLANAQDSVDAGNTTAVGGPLTEGDLMTALEQAYTAGGTPDTVLVAPNKAITIAGFATTGTGVERNFNDGTTTYTNAVDIIRSPFGTVAVVLDRFTDPATALVYDKNYFEVASLRPTKITPLAKTGSAEKIMIECEKTLCNLAPKAHALLDTLT